MVTRIVQGWKEIITKGTVEPVQVTGGSINVVGLGGTTVKAAGTVLALPAFTRATILTVIADINFLNLSIISVSGEDYAKFYLVINGDEIDIRRSGPSRNMEFNYTGAPIELAYGDIVDVQVEHYNPSSLVDFDCTIYGFGDVYAQLLTPDDFELTLSQYDPTISISISRTPSTIELTAAPLSPYIIVDDSYSNATVDANLTIETPVPVILIGTQTLPLLMSDIVLDSSASPQTLTMSMSDIVY